MSFLDSLTGAGSRAQIGELTLDASVREVHEVSGVVTEHPVEKGIDITDNYRTNPRTIVIEGVITNTPISTSFPIATTINAVNALVNGDEQPVTNARKELERYFDEKEIISISTSLKDYDSMVLTDLSMNRDNLSGNKLEFSATAREIRIVQTKLAAAIALAKSALAKATKSRGTQTNKDTAAGGVKEQQSSAAIKLGKFVGLFK